MGTPVARPEPHQAGPNFTGIEALARPGVRIVVLSCWHTIIVAVAAGSAPPVWRSPKRRSVDNTRERRPERSPPGRRSSSEQHRSAVSGHRSACGVLRASRLTFPLRDEAS